MKTPYAWHPEIPQSVLQLMSTAFTTAQNSTRFSVRKSFPVLDWCQSGTDVLHNDVMKITILQIYWLQNWAHFTTSHPRPSTSHEQQWFTLVLVPWLLPYYFQGMHCQGVKPLSLWHLLTLQETFIIVVVFTGDTNIYIHILIWFTHTIYRTEQVQNILKSYDCRCNNSENSIWLLIIHWWKISRIWVFIYLSQSLIIWSLFIKLEILPEHYIGLRRKVRKIRQVGRSKI